MHALSPRLSPIRSRLHLSPPSPAAAPHVQPCARHAALRRAADGDVARPAPRHVAAAQIPRPVAALDTLLVLVTARQHGGDVAAVTLFVRPHALVARGRAHVEAHTALVAAVRDRGGDRLRRDRDDALVDLLLEINAGGVLPCLCTHSMLSTHSMAAAHTPAIPHGAARHHPRGSRVTAVV